MKCEVKVLVTRFLAGLEGCGHKLFDMVPPL